METRTQSELPGDNAAGEEEFSSSYRRCLLSRSHDIAEHMLRFVVGPGDMVVPDLARRLPGRGMWLCADRASLEDKRLPQFFARAAKRRVHLPQGLLNLVEEGLAKRLQSGISLGRRAGEAVCGFQKCREHIVSGKVGVVICAAGASRDELARLVSGHRDLPVVWVPEKVLASAFGREKAVYAVMLSGALARQLMAEYKRFSGVAGRYAPKPSGVE